MTCNLSIETKPGSTAWRDSDQTPWMIPLPPAEFLMGENDADKFANDTERPAHRVQFAHRFALGKFPVTVGEFRHFRPEHLREETAGLPVIQVSWHDADAYCDWLTERTGRAYRLPAEAEWEFACRAGSRTPFSSGNTISPALANFLYNENGLRVGAGRRSEAGNYPPNDFGFHDLHGNVCEWMADHWHPDYADAPADGSEWLGADGQRRVIRGGAWDYLPSLLRSSWRDWRDADFCADNLGFRVAASIGPGKEEK